MHILIVYGTYEGQTAKIADVMAELIRNKGHQVRTLFARDLPDKFFFEEFDAVIVGASIHMGRYPRYITDFVKKHLAALQSVNTAFFTVCMAINSQRSAEREEARQYAEAFFKETGWRPDQFETFAGAVKYTQYNFVMRLIMKMISKREGGSTDTSIDHEYTDWSAVSQFTRQFVASVEEREPA